MRMQHTIADLQAGIAAQFGDKIAAGAIHDIAKCLERAGAELRDGAFVCDTSVVDGRYFQAKVTAASSKTGDTVSTWFERNIT